MLSPALDKTVRILPILQPVNNISHGQSWGPSSSIDCAGLEGSAMRGSSSTIPVIDLDLLLDELAVSLHQACTTVGFFQLVNHGVSVDLQKTTLHEARNMFALSEEAKEAFAIEKSKSYRGYQRIGQNIMKGHPDGHEALDIFSESELAKRVAKRHGEDKEAELKLPTNYGKKSLAGSGFGSSTTTDSGRVHPRVASSWRQATAGGYCWSRITLHPFSPILPGVCGLSDIRHHRHSR